jgi:hypothetical protein
VLIYEQYRNVFALACEAFKSGLDGGVLSLRIHNEEVLLAVRRLGNMLERKLIALLYAYSNVITHSDTCEEHARYCILQLFSYLRLHDAPLKVCAPHRRSRQGTACPCMQTLVLPWCTS